MSNRGKCIAILDSFDERQLVNIVAILQAAKDAIEDAADDAYCNALLRDYEADPGKGDVISVDDAVKMFLGG